MTVEAYPYFKLAKRHNVDYGIVQCFAWAYRKKFANLNYWETQATRQLQGTPLAADIIAAYHTELSRRVVGTVVAILEKS